MVANVVVAIVCNVVAVALLLSGVFSAKSNGIKVTLVKVFMSLGGVVGAFFATPALSRSLYKVEKVPELLSQIGISLGTINSCIFLLVFLLAYGITLITCSIVKHALIKKLLNKRVNRAKLKRARSINPRAERTVKRAEWKAARRQYNAKNKWYSKCIACVLGAVIAVMTGLIVLMPFGYIGKDIEVASDKTYLVDGFKYTLNGVIGEDFFDWAIHNEAEAPESDTEVQPDVEEAPEVDPAPDVDTAPEVDTEAGAEE